MQNEVLKRLKPVSAEHVKRREAVVSGWKAHHKPKFDANLGVSTKQIFVQVLIKNGATSLGKYGGTIEKLWDWFNLGTRPHRIVPRFKSILRFAIGGVVAWSSGVNHPGTKGTGDNERINAELDKKLRNEVENGYKAGFRKL